MKYLYAHPMKYLVHLAVKAWMEPNDFYGGFWLWYDPAKSTKDLANNVATILQNTLDEKNNFYLKYAN